MRISMKIPNPSCCRWTLRKSSRKMARLRPSFKTSFDWVWVDYNVHPLCFLPWWTNCHRFPPKKRILLRDFIFALTVGEEKKETSPCSSQKKPPTQKRGGSDASLIRYKNVFFYNTMRKRCLRGWILYSFSVEWKKVLNLSFFTTPFSLFLPFTYFIYPIPLVARMTRKRSDWMSQRKELSNVQREKEHLPSIWPSQKEDSSLPWKEEGRAIFEKRKAMSAALSRLKNTILFSWLPILYRQSDSNRYELLPDFLKVMCLPFHHGGGLSFSHP